MLTADNLKNGYFLRSGDDFNKFWHEYLKKDKKILYILGLGFDPRTLSCFRTMYNENSKSNITCMVINYSYDFESNDYMKSLLKSNNEELIEIISRTKWKIKKPKKAPSKDYSVYVDLITQFELCDIEGYSDIVIDISAMPDSLYFPLIKTVLDWIKNEKILYNKSIVNLHIVVAENATFDSRIKHKSLHDNMKPIYKFSKSLTNSSTNSLEKIWMPILGENHSDLDKFITEHSIIETYPIFPTSSMDPYRIRNLILEYREILFDALNIDARNFIFAYEQNPFETCRQIYYTVLDILKSFEILEGANIIISPLSSKLLCLGSFFAAYMLTDSKCNVSVMKKEVTTYELDKTINLDDVKVESKLFTMWITGEVYADQ